MLKQSTINQLRTLNLRAMVDAAKAIDESGQSTKLTKDDYVSLLVERLYEEKMARKLANLICGAHMEVPGAFLEDLCMDTDRHLDPQLIARLATCEYISKGHNVHFFPLRVVESHIWLQHLPTPRVASSKKRCA